MELSKKVAYLRGLMEGLKLDSESPEGQVLKVMADILADIADEVEENSFAVNAISDYIDLMEDGSDPLDEIDTYEYGFDPEKGEDADNEEDEYEDGDGEEDDGEEDEVPEPEQHAPRPTFRPPFADKQPEPEQPAVKQETQPEAPKQEQKADSEGGEAEDENIHFNSLLDNIMSDPDYTDDGSFDNDSNKLIETLKNMVVKGYEEAELEEAKKRAEGMPVPHVLDDEERDDFITRLEELLNSVQEDEDEADEEAFDSVIGRMRCPFCHRDIDLKVSDIAEKIVSCPFCGNKLTIML